MNAIYQYDFGQTVDIREAEATLLLVLIAAEALHGATAVRMHGQHEFDPKKRRCRIPSFSRVGRDMNRLFIGFLNREFGAGTYSTQRIDRQAQLTT